jgi:hypothetical protein
MPAFIRSVAVALASALAMTSSAWSTTFIDTDATGNWFNPDQPGHGLQIEIVNNSQAIVAWYAYSAGGEALWLFGQGLVQGTTIEVELDQRRGALFPPDFDSRDILVEPWGRLHFELTGCNQAHISFEPSDPDYQAGAMDLMRASRIDGLTCPPDRQFDQVRQFNLDRGKQAFQALFLDYPDGEEDFYELEWGHETLPGSWSQRSGVRISGSNRSDDLLMLLMRPVEGLQPDGHYAVELEMQFASDVPSGCLGIGGSPGDSVYMKLGASGQQPDFVLEDSGLPDVPPMRRASFDLGQQSQPGEFAMLVGTMANGLSDELCGSSDRPWVMKRLSSAGQDFTATADEHGRLWIYALSDSGFEGVSTWYLTDFVVRLRQL